MSKKILIIRHRFVGDTVLFTSFIKSVKEGFEDSEIDVLVSPNSGELIENNPNVNNVFYLSNTNFHKYEQAKTHTNKSNFFYSLIGCALKLKKNSYDTIFVLKRSFSSALLAKLIGAKNIIGFNTEHRSLFLTHPVEYKENMHELDNFLNCLKPLGVSPIRHNPEIFPTDKELEKAKTLTAPLSDDLPKVLVHMTSAHPLKEWAPKYVGELMDKLFEHRGAQFVFTGANIDKDFYQKALKKSRHGGRFKFLDLCGKTSLRECFAVYQRLDFAITVDSGNSHLSAAAGIPTYVVYGPTRPEKWLPIGNTVVPVRLKQLIQCQPCDVKIDCSHKSCLKMLTPSRALSLIK